MDCCLAQEEFINGYQANIINFWEEFGSEMASQLPSMSLDTFKYARSLVRVDLAGMSCCVVKIGQVDRCPRCQLAKCVGLNARRVINKAASLLPALVLCTLPSDQH